MNSVRRDIGQKLKGLQCASHMKSSVLLRKVYVIPGCFSFKIEILIFIIEID